MNKGVLSCFVWQLGVMASILVTVLLSDGCNKKEIQALESILDKVQNESIASIDKQITGINASIDSLEKVGVQVDGYIKSLQTTASNLQTALDATDEALNQAKTELNSRITTEKAAVLAELASAQTAIQNQIGQINLTISSLQTKDAALDARIDNLKAYVDLLNQGTRDWASASFSTLQQYNQTVLEIAGIKADMTTLNNDITSLETRLNTKIGTDIAAAVSSLEGTIATKVSEVTTAYTTAISTAKTDITNAYTSAIASAISASEGSMKGWVNEQLTGYYTIAQTDAMLSALETSLTSQLNSQKSYLEGLIGSLNETLVGKIDANAALIVGLRSDLDTLRADVAENVRKIADNATQIATNAQSISANAQAIAAHTIAIETNATLIEQNKNAVAANAALIAANTTAINNSATAIGNNVQLIATNAQSIAHNASLISANATAIANNAQAISENTVAITALADSLVQAKSKLTTAYMAAINSAVNELEGKFDTKLATEIAGVNNSVVTTIATVNTEITNLKTRVSTLETAVDDIRMQLLGINAQINAMNQTIEQLIGRIQSAVPIPTYSDGSVGCSRGEMVYAFEVSPAGLATQLATADLSCFQMKAIYTQTKSTFSFVEMPISKVGAEGNVLLITASGANLSDDFFGGLTSASANLTISQGLNRYVTNYFSLYAPVASTDVVAVDLGLSVKWASCNLGASSPEEYGDYYAWGETETKDLYDWTTYKWCTSQTPSYHPMSKYNNYNSSGWVVDNIVVLESGDDVANFTLGGNWRMPTKVEAEELLNPENCKWEWTSMNNANGYKITSLKPGYIDNWIFLPAAGWKQDDTLLVAGERGGYWTSSVNVTGIPTWADMLFFTSTSNSMLGSNRCRGKTVRPVLHRQGSPRLVTNIILSNSYLSLIAGEKKTISATISPTNATSKTLNWTSSNESIATVDSKGQIFGLHAGEATITAWAKDAGGVKASCVVTVTSAPSPVDNSANCYIVSASGTYSFNTVKGNSSESVGDVYSAEVLWESFGSEVTPNVGDIINNVAYSNGTITYSTGSVLNNGNAVIAAKDVNGEILWSWHIWVCEGYNPETTAQEYYFNAGTMMDRNLGAISATPGDGGALGLMYQWGRKDPFLGANNISSSDMAASTYSPWLTRVSSATYGTIEYATKNPTTFIYQNGNNQDWLYSSDSTPDNTRWMSIKTIYDPCPIGWRVPNGGTGGVWYKLIGNNYMTYPFDSARNGMNFSGQFGDEAIWYPAAGWIAGYQGYFPMQAVGESGVWWSWTSGYAFCISGNGSIMPAYGPSKSDGLSVRCQKE